MKHDCIQHRKNIEKTRITPWNIHPITDSSPSAFPGNDRQLFHIKLCTNWYKPLPVNIPGVVVFTFFWLCFLAFELFITTTRPHPHTNTRGEISNAIICRLYNPKCERWAICVKLFSCHPKQDTQRVFFKKKFEWSYYEFAFSFMRPQQTNQLWFIVYDMASRETGRLVASLN